MQELNEPFDAENLENCCFHCSVLKSILQQRVTAKLACFLDFASDLEKNVIHNKLLVILFVFWKFKQSVQGLKKEIRKKNYIFKRLKS